MKINLAVGAIASITWLFWCLRQIKIGRWNQARFTQLFTNANTTKVGRASVRECKVIVYTKMTSVATLNSSYLPTLDGVHGLTHYAMQT